MQGPTVALVWHDGGMREYTEAHALTLTTAIFAHWPRDWAPPRVVVLTNAQLTDPAWGKFSRAVEQRPLVRGLTGWWNKLELCDAQHDDLGAVLYMDLDTMVTGDLAAVASAVQVAQWPILLEDFYQKHRTNSGLMGLPVSVRQDIRAIIDNLPRGINSVLDGYRGDGDFFDAHYRDTANIWQLILPRAVKSYKVHVRQVKGEPIPTGCAVLCFHGHPRPWQSRLWPQYLKDIGL